MEEHDGCEDEEDVLEDTGHGKDHGGGFANLGGERSQVSATVQASIEDCTYQKHHGNVQEEGDQSVSDEGHNTQRIDVVHSHAREFSEEHDDAVGNRASRGKVVDGNQGVHFEFGRAEETLDHDQAQRLEDDTTDLDWGCLLGTQHGK